MKLNRKLWTAALAVAMTTPSAMAAQDTSGMQYTSASEGFYASIRLRYESNGNQKDGGADIENGSSRFGVRGTNDLGGGLEGYYQYEAGVGTENSSGLSTRVAHVGLRGDFGDVVAGAFWTNTYNWVDGSTDIANKASGNFAYSGHFGQARSSKSLQYTTPDLNGFQGAVLVKADSASDGKGATKDGDGNIIRKDDNDIDHWSLAAKYEIAGFSMGASYANSPDAIYKLANGANNHFDLDAPDQLKADLASQIVALARSNATFNAALTRLRGTVSVDQYVRDAITVSPFEGKEDDMTSWAVKLGYSQDNWYVNSWYGEINHGDAGNGSVSFEVEGVGDSLVFSTQDSEVFSIAGGISVDKVAVYALHENAENLYAQDDSYTTLGVQYSLGSRSRVWVEYAGTDQDSSDSEDDSFNMGLRHDF